MSLACSTDALIELLGHVSTALASGQPLAESLATLARKAGPSPLGQRLTSLSRDLGAGLMLSESLDRCGIPLAPFTLALVRAGEASGDLAGGIRALHDFHLTSRRLQQRFEAATLYPRIVLFVAFALVLPVIAWSSSQYLGTQSIFLEGPPPTLGDDFANRRWLQMLIGLPQLILVPYQQGPLACLLIAVISAFVFLKPVGPLVGLVGAVGRHVFLIGPTLKTTLASRFSTALGLLVMARVPMNTAIAMVAQFAGQPHERDHLNRVTRSLEQGMPLSEALSSSSLFPTSLSWLVALGERGNNLGDCLLEAGRYFKGESEYMLDLMSQALEPIFLMVAAGVSSVILFSAFSQLMRVSGVTL